MKFQHLETIRENNKIIVVGRTKENESIAVVLDNVTPFLIVENSNGLKEKVDKIIKQIKFCKKLNTLKGKVMRSKSNLYYDNMSHNIKFELLEGQDVLYYNEYKKKSFLKIICKNIYDYYMVKKIVTGKEQIVASPNSISYREVESPIDLSKHYVLNNVKMESVQLEEHTVYNDQVDYSLQHFIENDWFSCSWFEVMNSSSERKKNKITTCDHEFEGTLKPIDQEGVAPWRILSYDIESLPPPRGNTGKFDFPSADKDPVITIGATLTMGSELHYYVWMLCPNKHVEQDKLYDVEGFEASKAQVFVHDNEFQLINDFIQFCVKKDVDFIQGHNVNRFDNDYLISRWNKLNKSSMQLNWSRLRKSNTYIKKSSFSSSQKGTMEKFKLIIPGRVVLDSYDIMKDQHNESSYKLDNLAEKYLGTKKVPMDYAHIYPKYKTQDGRLELAVYCLKDAWLVHALLEKLCKLMVILQMANVTGISVKDVMDRGQGIRTVALMIRYAKKHNYFIPRVKPNPNADQSFEGAVVVDPDAGFYKDAVSCLDFASLYPSIMQALNMSYETLVSREKIKEMGWEEDKDVRTIPDYELVDGKLVTTFNPKNPSFVTKETRVGLLTEMLETILAERKKVKKMMKKEKPHSTMYNVYNGRQLGLKVVANSIYGFTGASVGFLPCKTIASSVTKYGRGLTLKTKSIIENHTDWGKNGAGCKCIYGDTDSVFVSMPRSLVDGKTKEELINNAHKMGEVMADYVTQFFLPPVFLEYEKTYSPYLLLKKKRYAGLKFEPGLPPKLHLKGIEAVRRDFAPLLVDTQKKLLNAVIIDGDIKKGCDIVHNTVKDLYKDKIPLNMFTMTKKLSRPPEEYTAKAPHVELALKLAKKDPVMAPVAGDRVEFVIYAGSAMISKRACVPKDITDGKYMVDREYYMNKQLKTPLLRILERIVKNPKDLFKVNAIKKRPPTGSNPFAKWRKKLKFS
ncbi:MAG: hypothetical protein CMF41_04360 [Legionellales bacterium]|nr:hypothetical protein [Legionellales bacterium]|tara:strand:+ start:2038 stop:4935 length:2898 start_codon:yes stop_codon:yes gene_type:complete